MPVYVTVLLGLYSWYDRASCPGRLTQREGVAVGVKGGFLPISGAWLDTRVYQRATRARPHMHTIPALRKSVASCLLPGVGGLWPPVRRRTSPRRRLYVTFRTDRTARGSLDHQKSLFLKQVYLTETRYAAVGQTAGASVGLARSPLHRPGLMPS